ncbi:MAG: hypothetical protein JNJ89_14275 [Rubrivivax sp.]|nr:hypothetical protein [Rubrivivax sp.]
MVAAVLLAWFLGQTPFFDPRTETGYWVGVAGGLMMVLLFAYPLRKRWRWLAGFGKARHWFFVHMVLGVAGPVIILAHSAFRIGSLNAGVALVSMLVVALSGVVGRFIYLHTHRGLGGERETLQALQAKLGLADTSTQGGLHFAPRALEVLHQVQAHAGHPGDRWVEHLARLTVLPLRLVAARRTVRRELDAGLAQWAAREQWPADVRARRLRKAIGLADEHLDAVLRVAQFAAYARIFSLWHLLHVPFVFMMVLCAVVHVVAVHAY